MPIQRANQKRKYDYNSKMPISKQPSPLQESNWQPHTLSFENLTYWKLVLEPFQAKNLLDHRIMNSDIAISTCTFQDAVSYRLVHCCSFSLASWTTDLASDFRKGNLELNLNSAGVISQEYDSASAKGSTHARRRISYCSSCHDSLLNL